MTFRQLLSALRDNNVAALKDRTFTANAIAKATYDMRSRRNAYVMKSRAMCRLLEIDAAYVNMIEVKPNPVLGISFERGGKLRVRPADLNAEAKAIVIGQMGLASGQAA
jgi:hypothetical protein